MGLRTHVRTIRNALYDACWIVAIAAVLKPAADRLTLAWSRRVAVATGAVFSFRPYGLLQAHKLRRSFNLGPAEAIKCWRRIQTRPFTDFAMLRRVRRNLERLQEWSITESGDLDAVNKLRSAESSFIVATGHFSREAFVCLFDSTILRQNVIAVVAVLPNGRGLSQARTRLNYGQLLDVMRIVRQSQFEMFENNGSIVALQQLVRRLRSPGTVAVVSPDAEYRHPAALRRPFASQDERSFATGTATMARLSQRPIISCVPIVDGPRRVSLQWGPVISPPPKEEGDADKRVTNALLDHFEIAVGEYPDQYVLPQRYDRRWDQETRKWM